MAHLGSSLVLGLVVVVLASPASAEKVKPKTGREKAAQKACALGDYQKGVDILADLLVGSDDPNYIYNQGRCYEQNSRWEQAINRFREYLRKDASLSDGDRADVERHISECEVALAKDAQAAQPPAAAAPAPVASVETPAPAPAPPPVKPEVSATPALPLSDGSQGKGLRVAGIVCAAVGLAAVGTGIGLALKTQSMSSDADKNGGTTQAQEDLRKSLETWGWVSYGVGAIAIATGAILYIVGWPNDKATNVALLPAAAPDGASMILKGRF
jgi:tetratricopeptide (TPR) repeat protein